MFGPLLNLNSYCASQLLTFPFHCPHKIFEIVVICKLLVLLYNTYLQLLFAFLTCDILFGGKWM